MKTQKNIPLLAVIAVCLLCGSSTASDVDTAWTRYYAGEAGLMDMANAVVVDDSNNIYVTGRSPASGHMYNDLDIYTIKYGPNGDTIWERRFNSIGDHSETGDLMALGGDGNIVIAGSSNANGAGYEIFVMKYNLNGDTLWTSSFMGPLNSSAAPVDMVVGPSGKVWITGNAQNGTFYDYLTLHFDAAGNLLWYEQWGESGFNEQPYAIAVDMAGNSYVTGGVDSSGNLDWYTIKYGPTGTFLGDDKYDGSAGFNDLALAIAYDTAGYVYVSGISYSGVGNDVVTIKYNLNVDTIWTRTFDGPGNGYDNVYAAELDPSGNLIISAGIQVTVSDILMGLLNYTPAGDTNWVRYFSPKITTHDMVLDPAGNIYIAGDGVPPNSSIWTDWVTIKYLPDGDTAWSRWLYDGMSSGTFQNPSDLALDGAGGVIVTGAIGSSDKNYCTRKYVQPCCDTPGDANNDGQVNVGDAVYLIAYVFKGGAAPPCMEEGDANADCQVNVGDAVYLIAYVFKGGAPPECGCAE
jgi:hypothetical protein